MPANHSKAYISINKDTNMIITLIILVPGFHTKVNTNEASEKTIEGSHPQRVNPVLNKNLAKYPSLNKSNNKTMEFNIIAAPK